MATHPRKQPRWLHPWRYDTRSVNGMCGSIGKFCFKNWYFSLFGLPLSKPFQVFVFLQIYLKLPLWDVFCSQSWKGHITLLVYTSLSRCMVSLLPLESTHRYVSSWPSTSWTHVYFIYYGTHSSRHNSWPIWRHWGITSTHLSNNHLKTNSITIIKEMFCLVQKQV